LDPVLKYVGGKRWALGALSELYAPHRDLRLVEPFVGSMTVALGLQPDRALLCDNNEHVINFHLRLRDESPFTVAMVNDEQLYYAQRSVFNSLIKLPWGPTGTEAAELYYYLNRTCFNGLSRFNKKGDFNVPFGKYATINYRRDFSEYAPVLRRWWIKCQSWDATLADCNEDDFVYADPPYDETFDSYGADSLCTWEQQVALAEALARLPGPVVASNAATERVLALYRGLGFDAATVGVRRSIRSDGDRAAAMEMLATKNVARKEKTAVG
jgi:DNA adenine methylase